MTDITSLDQLSDLVRADNRHWLPYGDVNAVYHDGLVLFNYVSISSADRSG